MLPQISLLFLIQRGRSQRMSREVCLVNRTVVVVLALWQAVGVVGSPQHFMVNAVFILLVHIPL